MAKIIEFHIPNGFRKSDRNTTQQTHGKVVEVASAVNEYRSKLHSSPAMWTVFPGEKGSA